MTREEVGKACRDKTTLVERFVHKPPILMVFGVAADNGLWWVGQKFSYQYVKHQDSLRIATAKEMILEDD